MYDNNNVFAKMIRGEIPTNKVYENDFAMSFHDINPTCNTDRSRFLRRSCSGVPAGRR